MWRRTFLKASSMTAAAFASGLAAPPLFAAPAVARNVSILPVCNAPPPLPIPHFPSRMHAFIWRNWPLVPVERIASVIGASRQNVERTARAMGLDTLPRMTREQQRRSYITIIKRNWHLLPYDQLLALLDWPAEKLAFTLREDDFLFIKLGSHKPKCEPLKWTSPDAETRAREHHIAEIVRETLPKGVHSK